MSTQVSYRPRITPMERAARAIAEANRLCPSIDNGWLFGSERQNRLQRVVSEKLIELESENVSLLEEYGDTARELLKTQALNMGIADIDNLHDFLKHKHQDALLKISRNTGNILEQLRQGTASENLLMEARSRQNELVGMVVQGHQQLLETENRVIGQLIGDILATMGYEIDQRNGAMRGTKGKTCVWIEVENNGDITLDVSGFSGNSCQQEIRSIEKRLAAIGLDLEQTASVNHGIDGGSLAADLRKLFAQQPERRFHVDGPRQKSTGHEQHSVIHPQNIKIGERG